MPVEICNNKYHLKREEKHGHKKIRIIQFDLEKTVKELEEKVNVHLERMGFAWK